MTCNLGEPTIAAFGYVGTSRRSSLTLAASSSGGGVIQTLDTNPGSVGLEGLDGFGRVADLHFQNGEASPRTMLRAQYTYDALGNRLTAELTQADVSDTVAGTITQDNKFSQVNSYDALNRLIKTEYGALTSGAISSPVRTDEWSLDLLGNWVGGAAAGTTGPPDGRKSSGDLDWGGIPTQTPAYDPPRGVEFTADNTADAFKWLQDVNPRNEIEQLDLDEDGSLASHGLIYDAAGNLTFDGEYFYQYDAWNRLVQINKGTWNTGTSSVDIDDIVKHYTYDGHGRLVRIQSPYPAPGQQVDPGDFRTERLYYDGIRRIQEVVVDPVTGESGGEESEGEDDQIGGGQAVEYLEREYVWGPGDNGLDELLVQYNGQGDEFWAIMDAGGDLVALCDLGGDGGAARVVGQWTYDAYGAVLSADHLHPMAHPHLGHKGLFVDRLDAGIVTMSAGPERPRLTPFAELSYYARNRNSRTDRWLQRDPNQSGQLTLERAAMGAGMRVYPPSFGFEQILQDGANLYQYVGSNPAHFNDPLGLFMVDAVGVYAEIGFAAGRLAYGLTQVYAENMEWDAEWAMNWDYQDDWHSRSDASWVDAVYASVGIGDVVDGYLDPTGGLAFGNASTGRRALETVSLLRRGSRLSGQFMQLHHILPRYFRYIIDKSSAVGARIPRDLHNDYHQYVSRQMAERLGSPFMNAGQPKWQSWIKDRARDYGGDVSRVKDEVKMMLQTLTEEWGAQKGIPGLSDVLRNVL